MCNVKRGEVYWFDPAIYGYAGTYKNGERIVNSYRLYKKRPHIMLADKTGGLVTAIPTGTTEKDYSSVIPVVFNGEKTYAHVEQITSIDVGALNRSDYIGDISDNDMVSLEYTIGKYLGLANYNNISLDTVAGVSKYFETLITDIVNKRVEVIKSKLQQEFENRTKINDKVMVDLSKRLGKMLTEEVDKIKPGETPTKRKSSQKKVATEEEVKKTNIEMTPPPPVTAKPEKVETQIIKVKRLPNKRWEPQVREDFIKDYLSKKFSNEQLADIYGLNASTLQFTYAKLIKC